MSQALCFNSITLSPVPHQDGFWIQARNLANALGYKDERSVHKIYERNKEEFSSMMSVVVNLTTGIAEVPTRIFSLRGCHLIAMFARTPVAKQFRRWVLDVLDKLAEEERARLAPQLSLDISTTADRKPLEKLVKVWASQASIPHAQAWTQVNSHFNLGSITELPTHWLSDAISFVEGKIDALTRALPPASAPALPCTEPVLDPATYAKGKRIFDMMAKLMTDFDLVKAHVQFWAHPGGRYTRLSPELETIYQNAADASKMALCSLNQAQYALRIAMSIKAMHKFDERGV